MTNFGAILYQIPFGNSIRNLPITAVITMLYKSFGSKRSLVRIQSPRPLYLVETTKPYFSKLIKTQMQIMADLGHFMQSTAVAVREQIRELSLNRFDLIRPQPATTVCQIVINCRNGDAQCRLRK